MRVLVAPDCFTGTLTAAEAAEAIASGWQRHAPADSLDLCPLSDGGPGFLDALHAGLGGRLVPLTVSGPHGDPAPAAVLLAEDGPTAYVESAQACGLHLVGPDRRDPTRTSTAGVGALLAHARAAGAGRIVVGLGGSATNDAGAGMLAALGDGLDRMRGGGLALRGLDPATLGRLADLRAEWAGVDLVAASDVDAPLLGPHGASLEFAEQKGASPEQARDLESALGEFAAAVVSRLGLPQRTVAEPGAGAAGGLGFGLLLLGARRVSGAQAVIDAVRLPDRVAGCDLVITGEGSFDWQSLRGRVVTGVARAALAAGRPVLVLAGQVSVGRREMASIGVNPPIRSPGTTPRWPPRWPTQPVRWRDSPSGWLGPGRDDAPGPSTYSGGVGNAAAAVLRRG